MNKSAKICLNNFGDTWIQTLKSGKTRKSGLFRMSMQEKLAELFLADLKYDQKRFVHIPSLNFPEIRPLGTF